MAGTSEEAAAAASPPTAALPAPGGPAAAALAAPAAGGPAAAAAGAAAAAACEQLRREAAAWHQQAKERLLQEYFLYVQLHRYLLVVIDDSSYVQHIASARGIDCIAAFLRSNLCCRCCSILPRRVRTVITPSSFPPPHLLLSSASTARGMARAAAAAGEKEAAAAAARHRRRCSAAADDEAQTPAASTGAAVAAAEKKAAAASSSIESGERAATRGAPTAAAAGRRSRAAAPTAATGCAGEKKKKKEKEDARHAGAEKRRRTEGEETEGAAAGGISSCSSSSSSSGRSSSSSSLLCSESGRLLFSSLLTAKALSLSTLWGVCEDISLNRREKGGRKRGAAAYATGNADCCSSSSTAESSSSSTYGGGGSSRQPNSSADAARGRSSVSCSCGSHSSSGTASTNSSSREMEDDASSSCRCSSDEKVDGRAGVNTEGVLFLPRPTAAAVAAAGKTEQQAAARGVRPAAGGLEAHSRRQTAEEEGAATDAGLSEAEAAALRSHAFRTSIPPSPTSSASVYPSCLSSSPAATTPSCVQQQNGGSKNTLVFAVEEDGRLAAFLLATQVILDRDLIVSGLPDGGRGDKNGQRCKTTGSNSARAAPLSLALLLLDEEIPLRAGDIVSLTYEAQVANAPCNNDSDSTSCASGFSTLDNRTTQQESPSDALLPARRSTCSEKEQPSQQSRLRGDDSGATLQQWRRPPEDETNNTRASSAEVGTRDDAEAARTFLDCGVRVAGIRGERESTTVHSAEKPTRCCTYVEECNTSGGMRFPMKESEEVATEHAEKSESLNWGTHGLPEGKHGGWCDNSTEPPHWRRPLRIAPAYKTAAEPPAEELGRSASQRCDVNQQEEMQHTFLQQLQRLQRAVHEQVGLLQALPPMSTVPVPPPDFSCLRVTYKITGGVRQAAGSGGLDPSAGGPDCSLAEQRTFSVTASLRDLHARRPASEQIAELLDQADTVAHSTAETPPPLKRGIPPVRAASCEPGNKAHCAAVDAAAVFDSAAAIGRTGGAFATRRTRGKELRACSFVSADPHPERRSASVSELPRLKIESAAFTTSAKTVGRRCSRKRASRQSGADKDLLAASNGPKRGLRGVLKAARAHAVRKSCTQRNQRMPRHDLLLTQIGGLRRQQEKRNGEVVSYCCTKETSVRVPHKKRRQTSSATNKRQKGDRNALGRRTETASDALVCAGDMRKRDVDKSNLGLGGNTSKSGRRRHKSVYKTDASKVAQELHQSDVEQKQK